MTTKKDKKNYPVLPLRDIVVFPHMIVPLFVGRDKSVKALEKAMEDDSNLLLVTQKNSDEDEPQPKHLYNVGTVSSILQLLKLPDGTVKVLVEGKTRAKVDKIKDNGQFFEAVAVDLKEDLKESPELFALARSVVSEFEQDSKA